MSTEDFQVQDIYRYSRKSYKPCVINPQSSECRRENDVVSESPISEVITNGPDVARCSSCGNDSEGEIANILHKKCPVIALAQQQLQRVLDETDKLLADNTQCCRSTYDFLCLCRDALLNQNRCLCFLIILAVVSFFLGLLFGAASCGVHLRKFNSPILSCIDNYFLIDKQREDKYAAIVTGGRHSARDAFRRDKAGGAIVPASAHVSSAPVGPTALFTP
ncbi:unnamed protein product [Leptosia nina]|uniref:Uncharacterized protein n=1 Tax=Leptosia nina TaxID=320188 RepID=A0AAV1JR51_9NEOP